MEILREQAFFRASFPVNFPLARALKTELALVVRIIQQEIGGNSAQKSQSETLENLHRE